MICNSFCVGGLQIGQQSNLLERLETQVLRLIDDHHRPPPCSMIFQQVAVKTVHQHLDTVRTLGIADLQFVAQTGDQLERGLPGIENQCDIQFIRQLHQQITTQHGLTRTDLASQLNETTAFGHAEDKMGQGLPMALAQKEKLRIRCN